MASLYPREDIEAQGGTQFASELKYFLAMDEFYNTKKSACNSREKTDRDLFTECVGHIVLLSDPKSTEKFYTKNFSKSFGQSTDFDIGSNFFSANAVSKSLTSEKPIVFPSRHPRLLICNKGKISIADDAYRNFSAEECFLGKSLPQKASILLFWLNRSTRFQSKDKMYDEFISQAKNRYTSELIQSLAFETDPVKSLFNEIKEQLTFDDFIHYLTSNDLSFSPAPSTPFAANVPSTPFDADATHLPPQIIYYGVPGCGKSNKINKALEKVSDERKIRTVFHPEYTNADFVGQILPKTDDGNISYEFTPGPFTEIIKRAGQEPGEDFYLIIEEINRGNAAAIFGDIFQLLDRDEKGISQYSIQNKDIAQYIGDNSPYINSKNNSIRLPSNLSIIATMNTSDQNVFTLDNAFQRRFDMVLVRSGVTRNKGVDTPSQDLNDYKFEPDDGAIRDQFESKIEGTNIPWGFFWDWVNSEIAGTLRGLSGTEDKRLGLWFVKNKNGEIPKKVFAEKVLKYLWDDAFKFKRKEIFCKNIQSLESLIDTFEKCKNLSEIFRDFPKDAIQNKA